MINNEQAVLPTQVVAERMVTGFNNVVRITTKRDLPSTEKDKLREFFEQKLLESKIIDIEDIKEHFKQDRKAITINNILSLANTYLI